MHHLSPTEKENFKPLPQFLLTPQALQIKKERKKERQTDRQTDRQTERQNDRKRNNHGLQTF